MKKLSIGVLALTCVIAVGCARQESAEPEDDVVAAAVEAPTESHPEAAMPAATIAPVNVQITLSPAAKTRLESTNEEISVAATYSGDPKEGAIAQAGPSGMIDLGKNNQLLSGEGTVVFRDDVIDEKRLAMTDGEVQLTINVTSAKKSGTENLLACPFYWDSLANASNETIEIDCTLISESTSR